MDDRLKWIKKYMPFARHYRDEAPREHALELHQIAVRYFGGDYLRCAAYFIAVSEGFDDRQPE